MDDSKVKLNLSGIKDGATKSNSEKKTAETKKDSEKKEETKSPVNKISLSELNTFKEREDKMGNKEEKEEIDTKKTEKEEKPEKPEKKEQVMPKISLSNINKKKDEVNSEKKSPETEEEELKEPIPQDEETISEAEPIKEENIETPELKPEETENTEVVEEEEDKTPETSSNDSEGKITLGGIKKAPVEKEVVKPKVQKVDKEKEELKKKLDLSRKLNEDQIEKDKPKKETAKGALFDNYESNFTKESKNIIKSMRKLRYIPKTRVGFVISLVIVTIISIGILFVVNPDTHSIENYKTSLVNSFEEMTGTKIQTGSLAVNNNGEDTDIIDPIIVDDDPIKDEKPIDEDATDVKDIPVIEENENFDLFYVSGYNYSVKHELNDEGIKTYIHEDNKFTELMELINYLEGKVETEKKGKIVDYLKNFYLKSKEKEGGDDTLD